MIMYQAWRRPGRKPRPVDAVSIERVLDRVDGHTTKRDIDETVGATDASLDPDGDRREEDGDKA